MVGHTLDRDVPPADAHDALDDADLDASFVENRALLDVQFQISLDIVRPAPCGVESGWIAAHGANSVTDRQAAVAHQAECIRANRSGHRLASEGAAFFVGETHDLERMTRRNSMLAEEGCGLDRADDADVAVVVATLRYGIDVRAEDDHGQFGIGPLEPPDDVAGRVDPNCEARVAHEFLDVFTTRQIRGAECHATDAAIRVGSEFCQCLDAPFDPACVSERQLIRQSRCDGRRQAREQHHPEFHVHPLPHEHGRLTVAVARPYGESTNITAVSVDDMQCP